MKIHNITEGYSYMSDVDPQPEQSVVDRFAGVADSQRSYYIMKWAEEKGIDSDDAMFKAGYVQDGYIGAGAWNWRYVGMGESVQEAELRDIKIDSTEHDIVVKVGDDKSYTLFIDGKKVGEYSSFGQAKKVISKKIKNESIQEAEQEMIGEPDNWYDAEERIEAYNQLQDALEQCDRVEADYVKDGVCPNCAGSSYIDGDYEEEEDSCDGWGNYGCDEGEMEYRNDTVSWKAITDHDEKSKQKAQLAKKPQPSDEILAGAMKQLHKNYVETGRFNAMELPSILRQMYPEISKQKAREIGSKFFKTFDTMNDPEPVAELKKLAGLGENTKDEQLPHCHNCKGKGCDDCDNTGEDDGYAHGTKGDTTIKEDDSDEAIVSKMLAKALGDENKWTEMSAPELYAELESTNPEVADMISKVAKMLYDVKLQERVYKDVGVADTVKDQRGKEFQFDKGSKKFKSQDGEEADVKTKLGKDLMRIRKNQMKKTTPSYKTKKNQGLMASIEEAYGDSHEITLEDNEDFNDVFGVIGYSLCEQDTFEAEYQGRKVKLNKPMQGDVKKFKVYVKDPKTGNVKKVNFGHGGSSAKGKTMKIRKSNPKARKSFRARHNCDNPGPKTKARYWSCRKW